MSRVSESSSLKTAFWSPFSMAALYARKTLAISLPSLSIGLPHSFGAIGTSRLISNARLSPFNDNEPFERCPAIRTVDFTFGAKQNPQPSPDPGKDRLPRELPLRA